MRFIGSVVVAAALLIASAATTKEFQPGGLRVRGVKRCAPIIDQKVLAATLGPVRRSPVRVPRSC
jgi:hypothetical protein